MWGYCGRYYEIDGGYIDGESQAYWLVTSPFDTYLPAPEPVHGQLYGTDTVVTGYPDDDELEAM